MSYQKKLILLKLRMMNDRFVLCKTLSLNRKMSFDFNVDSRRLLSSSYSVILRIIVCNVFDTVVMRLGLFCLNWNHGNDILYQRRTASLETMPRARYYQLKRMQLMLANQSEDCLYLNVYAPSEGSTSSFTLLFCLCCFCLIE